MDWASTGSSPQARGTLSVWEDWPVADRFIPAGAGNTLCRRSALLLLSVHPRRRGEHRRSLIVDASMDGSSPQARGTHLPAEAPDRCGRFIPAGAGNTLNGAPILMTGSVHPRRRGEHRCLILLWFEEVGSSPQARGTLFKCAPGLSPVRFIPAGAGNTSVISLVRATVTVHPRRRGEHFRELIQINLFIGSSPQARGTHEYDHLYAPQGRFIPAGAGNTGS